jgi:aminopeptidase N
MSATKPVKILLKDYTPPAFKPGEFELDFNLNETATVVKSKTIYTRVQNSAVDLALYGQNLKLIEIKLDGVRLADSRYFFTDTGLTIRDVPDRFLLEIETLIDPLNNLALEGLYMSAGRFCTQCESQGFRRITYALDRPDVLTTFRVRAEANKALYPTLISNGNRVDYGVLDNGRHFGVWHDPFPKPCYLFALVAGGFDMIENKFCTKSGRDVTLQIHVDQGDAPLAAYAMDALKRAMAWDEKVFNREYDLDIFHIVAVRDFNYGAMENKGLNIFNSSALLADPDTATDGDYHHIERVVAHEYFHNWSGNRVTLRDWFQLCLKEGLTVYRDEEFSADQGSRHAQRILDVRNLRETQWAEDLSALAHPVRPDSYEEITNFYTPTIYRKGAELVRVLRALIGPAAFKAGMELYFTRHDGHAVTVEDFVACFAETSGMKLDHFFDWYLQEGVPQLTVARDYDPGKQTLTLHMTQRTAPTPRQKNKKPLPIPLHIGFVSAAGEKIQTRLAGANQARDSFTLVMDKDEASFVFEGVDKPAIPAVLRGFEAPVIVHDDLTPSERLAQMQHEPDPFTRWEAGQTLIKQAIFLAAEGKQPDFDVQKLIEALGAELARAQQDPKFTANALDVPDMAELVRIAPQPDTDRLYAAWLGFRRMLATGLEKPLVSAVKEMAGKGRSLQLQAIGERALLTVALEILTALGDTHAGLAGEVYAKAQNMTETMGALRAAGEMPGGLFDDLLRQFIGRWNKMPLVMDKWFSVQAAAQRPDALARLGNLTRHELFSLKNPNRARSVYGAFANANMLAFHRPDGSGYRFLANAVGEIDGFNPMVAARLVRFFNTCSKFAPPQKEKAMIELKALLAKSTISVNLKELIDRMVAT